MSLISRHSYKLIAKDFEVSNVWREIPVELIAHKSKQEVTLSFADAVCHLEKDIVTTLNGVAIEPLVEVKELDGAWQTLPRGSYRITDVNVDEDRALLNRISFPVNATKSKAFVALRIRASHAITCQSILWHCYYPK